MKTKIKFWPIFLGLVLVGIFLTIAFKFSELETLFNILRKGTWYWVLILIFTQVVFLYSQLEIFSLLFGVFKVFPSLRKIAKIYFSINFANLTLPSAGVSGLALFAKIGPVVTGIKNAQAFVLNLMYYLINYASFCVIIVFAFPLLKTIDRLQTYHYLSASVIFLIVIFGIWLVYLAFINKSHLKKIIKTISSFVNSVARLFLKKDVISTQNSHDFSQELHTLAKEYKNNKNYFIESIFFSLAGHLLQIAVLYFSFYAFGINPPLYVVLVGYIFSIIFVLVSPTPSGIGIVEPTMVLMMSSMGVSIESATIATMVFRGISFWMPFFIGMFAARNLKLADSK